jgi:hypothetical protein
MNMNYAVTNLTTDRFAAVEDWHILCSTQFGFGPDVLGPER